MLIRMLKNDLRHGLLANLVMMIFICISTMLACTSISLIYSSQNQVSYFMNDMGNVADYNFSMMNIRDQDITKIKAFLKEKKLKDYQLERDVTLPLTSMRFNGRDDLESSGCFATTLPETYNIMFDEDNKIPVIRKGEVGIPLSMKNQLDLEIGDRFQVLRNGKTYVYRISCFTRDSLYGSEMMGQKRILFHPSDFKVQQDVTDSSQHAVVLSINKSEEAAHLEYDMQHAGLPGYILVDKNTAELSFMGVGIGTSALMMMSGVILLCMAFLIIRFTILFQLESNYTEIGIMKAIGFTHAQIKPLYLIKYMGIALMGTLCGFGMSIPFTNMLEIMQAGMVPIVPGYIGTLLSAVVVIAILGLVWWVTTLVLHRLKKQSTMDAIRKGNEGTSYQPLSRITLAQRSHMRIPVFLAVNDLFAHVKNTIMMIAIYGFCMLLILMPLSLKDSFQKDAFLQLLNMSVADLYTQQNGGIAFADLEEKQRDLKHDLQAYDPNVQVYIETMTSASLVEDGVSSAAFLMKRGNGNDETVFSSGKQPHLDNEIALTSMLAKRYDKHVGDSIVMVLEGVKKEYLITGIYSSVMNLGSNVLGGDIPVDFAYTGYLVVHFSGSREQRAQISEKVLAEYKGIKLIDGSDMMRSFSGDMPEQIKMMSNMIIAIMLFIVFALTVLFSKLHMLRSKKAIALMQSLGYHRRHIRRWLMLRTMMQACFALILGIGIHVLLTNRLLEMYFVYMGMGSIHFVSNTWNTFVMYPLLFITMVLAAQCIVNRTLHPWNVDDLREE